MVYSTNPNYIYEPRPKPSPTGVQPSQQDLRVWLERHRAGKVACVLKGFIGSDEELKTLAGALKTLCGVGGTAKNGEIIIQGDHREKIMTYLLNQGYGAKKAGG